MTGGTQTTTYLWLARAYWVMSGASVIAFCSIGGFALAALYGAMAVGLALANERMSDTRVKLSFAGA